MIAEFFDYDLPPELIAQSPVTPRDHARLLVVRRQTGQLEHHIFKDLPELLSPGDLLVLNDTKVLPARLLGRRLATGGRWEALYLRTTADGLWEVLAKTRGHPVSGEVFVADRGSLKLILHGRTADHHWLMQPDPPAPAEDLLLQHGQVPLPPYIRKGQAEPSDRERYQTVYAQKAGSVAAPTAGLHFTPQLLERLQAQGVLTARVTLHVGYGTFAPVKTDPAHHTMHSEWCEVDESTVKAIEQCKARGGRIIAVGTTTVRTLESAARPNGLRPFRGETNLYILPPFQFHVLDGLITNFHLPRTTLLMLVAALTGADLLKRAYDEAIRQRYRFYSYGDAMLIL